MKKAIAVLLIALSVGSIGAQGADQPVDLVVLLDVSQSMFPYFQDVVDFVLTKVASDYLRFGDTFHLLSFADDVRIEIVQQVRTDQDLKSVLGRLFLLYPFGRNTDFVTALGSLRQYLTELPSATRKLAVVVTDGYHNPSPQSAYASLDQAATREEITLAAKGIRENGWELVIIKLPFGAAAGAASGTTPGAVSGTAPSGTADGAAAGQENGSSPASGTYLDDLADALGVGVTDYDPANKGAAATKGLGIPEAKFPGPLGTRAYAFSFPLEIDNVSDTAQKLELDRVLLDGKDILERNVIFDLPPKAKRSAAVNVKVPADTPQGPAKLEIALGFSEGKRVAPQTGVLDLTLKKSALSSALGVLSRVWLFLVILAVALIGLLVVIGHFLRHGPREAEAGLVNAVLDSHAAEQAAAAEELRAVARKASEDRAAYLAAARGSSEGAPASQANVPASAQHPARSGEGARVDVGSTAPILFASGPEDRESAADVLSEYKRRMSIARDEGAAERKPAFDFHATVKNASTMYVEFTVIGQTTLIGRRNIKSLHAGAVKTIGGGRSDFLVFLVPMPGHIAELHFDGEALTLVPKRRDLFPDCDAPVVDCLDKEIPFVSAHGWPMKLKIKRYVPPVERINSILHCIETPGTFTENGK